MIFVSVIVCVKIRALVTHDTSFLQAASFKTKEAGGDDIDVLINNQGSGSSFLVSYFPL